MFIKQPSKFGEYDLNKKNWVILCFNYLWKILNLELLIREDDSQLDFLKMKKLLIFVIESRPKNEERLENIEHFEAVLTKFISVHDLDWGDEVLKKL